MDIQVESSELKRLINEMHDVTNTWSVADMVHHVWQQAQKAAMPDGFVMVPEMPSKNTIIWIMHDSGFHFDNDAQASGHYKAMVKAAEVGE